MPSTDTTPCALPLDYSSAPRNRRWLYRLLLAALLLGLALVGWKWGPRWWGRAEMLYWQHECLQFSLPPDTVVYEEGPAEAAALLAGNAGYHAYPLRRRSSPQGALSSVTAAALDIPDWNKLTSVLPRSYSPLIKPAVIFLHERISPAGHRRLVCVRYGPEGETFNAEFIEGFNCDTFAVTPGTWSRPPVCSPQVMEIDVISSWPAKPPLVRIFAGQPDPDDPAHFTIRYRMWGQEDVLDGRLLDNDEVTLTPIKQPGENN